MFEPQKLDLSLIHETAATDYIKSFMKRYDFTELIPFNDNFLSGNWKGKNGKSYGLFIFEDHSTDIPLKSFFKMAMDYEEETRLDIYCFSNVVIKEIIDPIIKNTVFFENTNSVSIRQQAQFVTVPDKNKIPEFVDLSKWKKSNGGQTKLSIKQFQLLMEEINKKPENERTKILNFYEKRVKKNVDGLMNALLKTSYSLEKPYVIRLLGNDDCSYAINFEKIEDAWKFYIELKEKAKTSTNGYKLMQETGMTMDD